MTLLNLGICWGDLSEANETSENKPASKRSASVFSFVAKIIDGNPSVDEANHFAIPYNTINCRLEFVKLEQVKKNIQEDELVSFEVPLIVEALDLCFY